MSRVFCIPGILFLLAALILSLLVSISLPSLNAIDIVRTSVDTTQTLADNSQLQLKGEIRYGIWTLCAYNSEGQRTCLKAHHGYELSDLEILSPQDIRENQIVKSSWTRGLAVHPVATGVIFVAFLLSFSTHITVTLIASIASFLAALLTLIAFAIDIAFLILVRRSINNLGIGATTHASAGFWMTFVTFILLLLAGCTVCFGRRRSTDPATDYPMQKTNFLSRFRR